MSVDGPRTSVFTFQSAVHSHHVLRSLEELRQKELLCDVTVEVERRSFRAHSSVLASCSGYFYTRLTNHSRADLTVRLPDEVDLPFPVEQISSMTRRAFLQMLKREQLTPEQLEFVQDVRRRSKNRMAAQRCRKRKLDCIYRLEGEIKKLRSEKEKLLQDHNQLKLSIEDVRQSLSGLCQSLCMDASSQSEQVQALTRYVSSDCPTSVLLTPIASPSLAGPDQDTHGSSSLDTFLADTCPEGDTVALRLPTAFLQDNVQSTVTDPAP
uniref:Uncharacterized protein n=1 Tax=Cyprinus carpio TaxID=7962 RepID=A0A8C2C674_CYPCA